MRHKYFAKITIFSLFQTARIVNGNKQMRFIAFHQRNLA